MASIDHHSLDSSLGRVRGWAKEPEQERSKKSIGPGREKYDKSKMSEQMQIAVDEYVGTKVLVYARSTVTLKLIPS